MNLFFTKKPNFNEMSVTIFLEICFYLIFGLLGLIRFCLEKKSFKKAAGYCYKFLHVQEDNSGINILFL